MKTLLKPGYKKIMKIFYSDKERRIHLRGIAKETGMNENSVTRFLKKLEEGGILKYEMKGNLKNYGIVKKDLTFAIFSFFDVLRLEKVAERRKKAINYFQEELPSQPVITLIFGSTAKGSYKKSSDLDLLLIVNNEVDVDEAEKYSESQTGIKINCFQINYEDFLDEVKLKKDKTVQSAISNGFPINNHIKYYNALLK